MKKKKNSEEEEQNSRVRGQNASKKRTKNRIKEHNSRDLTLWKGNKTLEKKNRPLEKMNNTIEKRTKLQCRVNFRVKGTKCERPALYPMHVSRVNSLLFVAQFHLSMLQH